MMNQCEGISKDAKNIFIKPALNSNELLLNMVNDILDFAEINKGELNMHF